LSRDILRSEYTVPNDAVAKIGLEQSDVGEVTLGSISRLSSHTDFKSVKVTTVKNIA